LQRFVDDELLRAPLLFEQLIDAVRDSVRNGGVLGQTALQRAAVSDAVQAAHRHRERLLEYFMHSLQQQVARELGQRPRPDATYGQPAAVPGNKAPSLALVGEEAVLVDVELSHAIEAVRLVAEHELLELQTYTSALVGDMEVARDHNPFRPESYARATWAAAHAIPLSQSHQVAFMRQASEPLAHLLRRSYAASATRLDAMGVQPAAYRTLILASGPRFTRPHITFSPDLQRVRDRMPVQAPVQAPEHSLLQAPGQAPAQPQQQGFEPVFKAAAAAPAAFTADPLTAQPFAQYMAQPSSPATAPPLPYTPGFKPAGAPPSKRLSHPRRAAPGMAVPAVAQSREHWADIARHATQRADRQTVELVSRLFDAMAADERLPRDVSGVVSRLQGPAMRLALLDPGLLDRDKHPLWVFINKLAFAAEMSPDATDPERVRLLRAAKSTVAQLQREQAQTPGMYDWALQRLEAGLHKRLASRLAAVASHIGLLQNLEARVELGQEDSMTLSAALDVSELDTVPAMLMQTQAPTPVAATQAELWLNGLQAGDWVRLFLGGQWARAQLLWPGQRRQIMLFGDGASDATWAVRRGALLMMHSAGLMKTLRQRSIVGSAAARVHEQVSQQAA
jgi:hypothetical protein